MAILRLNLSLRVPAPPGAVPRAPVFATTNLGRRYFPTRGVVFSLLFHLVVFAVLVVAPLARIPELPVFAPKPPVLIAPPVREMTVLFLPLLGNFGNGGGAPPKGTPARIAGGGSGGGHRGRGAASASGTKGLSYPGLQPILSDLPNPTNKIQTLLQPRLQNPPVLAPPLALPNLVQIADEGDTTPAPQEPAEPKPALPPAPPPVARLEAAETVQLPNAPRTAPAPAIEASKPVSPPMILPAIPEPEPEPVPPAPVPKVDPAEHGIPIPPPQKAPVPVQAKVEPPRPPAPPPVPRETSAVEPPPKPQAKEEPSKPAEKTAAKPSVEPKREPSPVSSSGPDKHSVLALSPMPAPPAQPLQIPSGEARGRFAISPEPNLSASETEPGSNVEARPSPEVGIGKKTEAPAGVAASANPSMVTVTFGGSGGGKGKDASGDGAGSGNGSGPGSGSGYGIGPGTGTGPGTGSGSGSGTGSGSGPGTGSGAGGNGSGGSPTGGSGTGGTGSGTGTGPGKGNSGGRPSPFAGITIVGGVGGTGGANSAPLPRTPRPLQTTYGLTVLSTESSGGGLPSFGVFAHERIYTVYLDVRRTELESIPSWTLEFALQREAGAQSIAPDDTGRTQQGVILPFPIAKERPAFPADLVRKYPGKMIIVYAVVNVGGRMEQMAVKESPDPLLTGPVLEALGKWVFRAARVDGEAVPAKLLMGIPLTPYN